MEAGIPAHGTLPVGRDVRFFKDVAAAWKLIILLRQKRPDILHVNSSKLGGIGAFAGRMARVKRIIFTAHGWVFNEDRSLVQKIYFKFLYWLTMALSHETIAVSEAARRQVRNWPFIKGKTITIYNGISKETGFSRSNARLELVRMNTELKNAVGGVSESSLIWIGTVAELHPIKGYRYALKAVADCVESLKKSDPGKRLVYTIMGEGQERPRLEALIKELRLEDNVFLMGHVDNAVQYASAFDMFLLASLSEGLGYVLLEAGACSVPVVATAVGGIPEVIEDMKSGILVQAKNPKELTHAIMFMVEHPKERHGYGAALHEKVVQDFSLDKMVALTERAYLVSV
jgi:glycosyltransferase involved in cell wall biosynthesis